MPVKKRPLPEPHKPAFGRRGRIQEKVAPALLADDIVRAAAEGRLEDLFGKEVPDSEQARALVSMLLGMSGMPSSASAQHEGENISPAQPEAGSLPEEVLRAAKAADVPGLVGLLRKEREKRTGEPRQPAAQQLQGRCGSGEPAVEKEVIDGLLGIAADNQVTLDWLVLRALKVYVREYRQIGRL